MSRATQVGPLPRMLAAFPDNITVVLPHARHYIRGDAPR